MAGFLPERSEGKKHQCCWGEAKAKHWSLCSERSEHTQTCQRAKSGLKALDKKFCQVRPWKIPKSPFGLGIFHPPNLTNSFLSQILHPSSVSPNEAPALYCLSVSQTVSPWIAMWAYYFSVSQNSVCISGWSIFLRTGCSQMDSIETFSLMRLVVSEWESVH